MDNKFCHVFKARALTATDGSTDLNTCLQNLKIKIQDAYGVWDIKSSFLSMISEFWLVLTRIC